MPLSFFRIRSLDRPHPPSIRARSPEADAMPLEPSPFVTRALLRSLVAGPLLVGDLPEADAFPHSDLRLPTELPPLSLEQKLGHLYEDALALLIEASPGYELLARNLQVQADAHRTLGELDFLLRDLGSDQLIHLELATKFYLAVPTDAGLTLPGPDARDNYFRKMERLRHHQLTLASRYRSHLPEVYGDEPILARHLITGCLFDSFEAAEPALPEFANPECRRGRWLPIDQLPQHFDPDTRFEIIPKPLWPVPLPLLGEIPLEPWSPDSPVERCAMLRVAGESVPWFVTPTGYPERPFS